MSRKVRIEGYEYGTAVLSEWGLYGSSSGPAGAMVGKVGDVLYGDRRRGPAVQM